MKGYNKLFFSVIAFYAVLFLAMYTFYFKGEQNLKANTSFLAEDSSLKSSKKFEKIRAGLLKDLQKLQIQNIDLEQKITTISDENAQLRATNRNDANSASFNEFSLLQFNPFQLLKIYKDPSKYVERPRYKKPHLGLNNDPHYCEMVDLYNMYHPENMFSAKPVIFTDHARTSVFRKLLLPRIGTATMWQINKYLESEPKLYGLDPKITTFFINGDNFHRYHEIGKNFLCATQMYNHIPGHSDLVRKDVILHHIAEYDKKHKDRPQCFNKDMFFPASYRLFVKEECKQFFNIVQSDEFIERNKTVPIQYLIKVGHGAHKSSGVFLYDWMKAEEVDRQYDSGRLCGKVNDSLIANTYVTNPLLLDKQNKFDIRVYMLIASTNPLILFYHDGYLRVSLFKYSLNSKERGAHITNTAVIEKMLEEAIRENKTLGGLHPDDVLKYHLWDFERLQKYLLKTGRISDENWLDNMLRPAIQRAQIHLTKMTYHTLWKESNVYELIGFDFMLDEDFNLKFIEANPNPLLVGVQAKLIYRMLKDLFDIEYAYYKSRMTRVLRVIQGMQKEYFANEEINKEKWSREYQIANLNRLEPEYQFTADNTWKIMYDDSVKGGDKSFGLIPSECFN